MLSSLAFAALALAAQASCQTPPGSLPTTGNTLAVDFPVGRNGYVEPNELLNQGVVANQPGISTHRSLTGTYMILMMDLSILDELTGKPAKQLVPGLQTNRTTFCHWLQTGLHQERNGMLASTNASALAPYRKFSPHAPAHQTPQKKNRKLTLSTHRTPSATEIRPTAPHLRSLPLPPTLQLHPPKHRLWSEPHSGLIGPHKLQRNSHRAGDRRADCGELLPRPSVWEQGKLDADADADASDECGNAQEQRCQSFNDYADGSRFGVLAVIGRAGRRCLWQRRVCHHTYVLSQRDSV